MDVPDSTSPRMRVTNITVSTQSYNIPSPSEMDVDAAEYVDVSSIADRDSFAIINPDNVDQDSEPLQDLPLANDYEAMKDIVLPPLLDQPKILEDCVNTWTVENWRSLGKKEHGPVFHAGGFPWRILLFPHGNNTDHCSIYLEHGFDLDAVPDNWSCCVQFALVLWNSNDPSLYTNHAAHHRFTKEEGDWGFTRFVESRRMFNVPWENSTRPLLENETANITAYVRLVEDETGVLWHNFLHYDSKVETGYVGLKNQGATCYLNSLLQSLYFTNAFRKAVYEIPTENDDSLTNSAYTLQRLFYQLQTSDQAVGTNELTKSFGWETRHIFEQQDVQELSRKLMERLEERMKGTKAENVLPEIFSGKIKTYISCINVDYESSRVEDFWDIQLNVSGNKSLLDSFRDYIQVEKMDGENQYFAGDEHKLQDADKGVIFNSFPDVLHLQLKRFEYDIQRDMMMKINDRYEFPDVFDAAPYLNDDADTSEPWTYQLHGVLVHSGDLNAGHYYAFIKPNKDGWFYKYDDDKVTKATLREVLEENFGGEERIPNGYTRAPMQKKAPTIRQNSAYMLVYIRQSRVDKILCPVAQSDIPSHLQQRLEEENALKEARRKEQREAHLYMMAKVITNQTFCNYGETDMGRFDNDAEDESAPRSYRLKKSTVMEDFVQQVARDIGEDPRKVRLWLMVNRQNKTIRPDQPVMDLTLTVEETYARSAAHRDSSLRLWAEVATEVDNDGEAIWPSYQAPAVNGSKEDTILLLLKYFDVEKQELRGVGHIYMAKDKKIEDMVPLIHAAMGWEAKLADDERLLLWEEIKPNMIEPLKPKFTLKMAELQDGDIICFQKTSEHKLQARMSDASNKEQAPLGDRMEDAREYYDFLEHRKTVRFHAHPTRCDQEKYPAFELVFNSKITYDVLSESVGAYLKVEPTHIRLWTVNASTNNPKAPVRRGTNPTLRQILHPTGGSLNSSQRNDAFYFEVLEMSLAELDTKKSVKLTWLSDGLAKEEQFDLLVPKTGTIEDLIQALVKKAKIADEAEGGRIRVYETSSNKFYREPVRDHAVQNLSEYTQIYAERVPADEQDANEANYIQVFHFQNEPSRTHGVPFRFLLVEGERFADSKKRLEKRTGLKGRSFEKIKFAIVRRSNPSKLRYLEDDDELWTMATSEDDFLGLDHPDRTSFAAVVAPAVATITCYVAERPSILGTSSVVGSTSPAAAMEAPKKKIAIMTSGGDSPGMNAVVRAVVRTAIHMGCDAFCIYEGYEGLVKGGDLIRQMGWSEVRGYLSEGGTLIGTARCMEFYERPGRVKAAKNMVLNGIDALIICGGDGSLTGADRFRHEWPSLLAELVSTGQLTADQVKPYKHLNIVGLVGSIDNDLSGTDATIGCYSALSRICEMVDYIEATAASHSRAFVIEVMGRHCGWLALLAGVATGADFVFIPERPASDCWHEEMCAVVKRHRDFGKRKTIVIVAEGANDKDGNKITPEQIKNLLADKSHGGLALDTRITTLGHVQRGGTAVAYDRMLGTLQGVEAVKAVLEATPETETCFIAINENKIVRKPLMKAVEATKSVAKAVEDKQFDKAMSLRDTEFSDQYKSYLTTTNVKTDEHKLPEKDRMKIGFINVGAPAGGMNAAVRAAVAYCFSRGHTPIAIHNGFAGFARHHGDKPVGAVREFDWLEVDGWASKGGSEIGTNRELPSESGMEHIANLIAKYEFDAIFMVGGFEAFHALSQLRVARDNFPSLRIPMVLLPATISNNVPGTEYSLGSDTCLNELVQYCDKIKQSASATRRRVFVIETQGGRSGYIATLAGLVVGASAVYIPEEGISLDMLNTDVSHLKKVFAEDTGQSRAGRLILINEKASHVYDAKLIASIIRDEAHGRFESRESIPGHVQQGGVPSPMDRCRAVRHAIKCMEHLQSYGKRRSAAGSTDPLSSSVIGIKGSELVFTPVQELEEHETDWPNRRPKLSEWLKMRGIVDVLGGRPQHARPESNLKGLLAKDVKRGLA